MTQAHFQLDDDFKPSELSSWYRRAASGDIAVITLPDRACKVRLIRGDRERVCWGPDGG